MCLTWPRSCLPNVGALWFGTGFPVRPSWLMFFICLVVVPGCKSEGLPGRELQPEKKKKNIYIYVYFLRSFFCFCAGIQYLDYCEYVCDDPKS